MNQDMLTGPVSEEGKKVLDLIKTNPRGASEVMQSLTLDDQVRLVAGQAARDPKAAQELLFLLNDDKGREIVDELPDRTVFRIMKSQVSTHIGMLELLDPTRMQTILDLDPELFSTKGITDPNTAYHWIVSFLEHDDAFFAKLLQNIDIYVVAAAFQDKVVKPVTPESLATPGDDDPDPFPADFMVKLGRGELKPDDIDVTDEETLDILTKIYLTDELYFNDLVSIMLFDTDLKMRAAEEALDRIHSQVKDIEALTEEAEDMFVPLED